ncbi:hypothetical protein QZH41_010750, partial [Actinostola sp. cb2023]
MICHDLFKIVVNLGKIDVFQKSISLTLEWLATTTEMVNKLGLFSTNEELEEVTTSDLRYFLLPALSGDLMLRQTCSDRMSSVKIAKIYFIDFLRRCKDYGITDKDVFQLSESKPSPLPGAEGLKQMANSRDEKIRTYKEQKQQENRLKELKGCVEGKSGQTPDEEIQREYYLLLIKIWVNKSTEHLASTKDELEILDHMQKLTMGHAKTEDSHPPRKPMKPILITKQSIKAKVFGAGYPSLPTMSQEEFLEKEIREGKVVLDYEAGTTQSSGDVKEGEEEKEDDPEELRKARSMDDWKD